MLEASSPNFVTDERLSGHNNPDSGNETAADQILEALSTEQVYLPIITRFVPQVIKIATQSPLSGPQSIPGVSLQNGARLAIEQKAGSLLNKGFIVELMPWDDMANPDTGVANAEHIVAESTVLCLVGHLNSGVMIPSMEVYHSAGLAVVSPANTNPTITGRGYREINRIIGRDDVQGKVSETFARQELGMQSVFIVHDGTSYGQGIADSFRQSAEANGVTISGYQAASDQSAFTQIISAIRAANPNMLYFAGLYLDAGVLFKQAREQGVSAQFMGPDGLDASDLVALAGNAAVGVHYTSIGRPASAYPGATQFIADYHNRFARPPQPFAAQAYDAAGVCLQAIERAIEQNDNQLPTRSQIADATRATADYPGITGGVTFNENGDNLMATYFVMRVATSNPAAWNTNPVVAMVNAPPP